MPKTVKKPVHYIDNKLFCKTLVEYSKACKKADRSKQEHPPIPKYLGECFMKIAQNLARRPNFMNYSYKDEMIMDGVENCLKYFKNFDPKKSENAFAYFTQMIFFAFLRRIKEEKKQSYVKYKTAEQFVIFEPLELSDSDENSTMARQEMIYDNISEYIHDFEQKLEDTRKKRKRSRKAIQNALPDKNLVE